MSEQRRWRLYDICREGINAPFEVMPVAEHEAETMRLAFRIAALETAESHHLAQALALLRRITDEGDATVDVCDEIDRFLAGDGQEDE